jgi:hypothetical protein
MVKFMQKRTKITSELYCETLKNCVGSFRAKEVECWHTVYCSSMTMRIGIQLFAPEHTWSILTGSCLTTLLTAMIMLRATTTCLPTWRTGWDHSASTIVRSLWQVSKCGWTHRQQISLTHSYKNLYPGKISASISVVTTFRSSLSRHVFLYIIFFLIACFLNSSPEIIFRIALVLTALIL